MTFNCVLWIFEYRDYVADLLENDRKFLVFAHHQTMLDAIEEALHKAKVKLYIYIDYLYFNKERYIVLVFSGS